MGCMGTGSWQAGSCSVGRAGRGKAVAREGFGQGGLLQGPLGPCDGAHGHRKPASKVFLLRTGCAEDKSGALLNVTGHLPIE